MKVTHYRIRRYYEGDYLGSDEHSDLQYLTRLYNKYIELGYKVELFRVGEELIESNFQKEILI